MKDWGLYGPKCGTVIQSRTQWRATEAAVASGPAQRICSIGFGSESSRDSQAARATLARNQRASARWQTAGERRRTSCSFQSFGQGSDSRAFRSKILRIHRRTSSCRRVAAVLQAWRWGQNRRWRGRKSPGNRECVGRQVGRRWLQLLTRCALDRSGACWSSEYIMRRSRRRCKDMMDVARREVSNKGHPALAARAANRTAFVFKPACWPNPFFKFQI
jgi:hypothetical protein